MIPVMRPLLGEEEAAAAADAVRSGLGRAGSAGGRASRWRSPACVGAGHGVAVSSCTTGLHLMLHRARRRAGRRGRRAVVLVHRHRERGALLRRHAGVRRRGRADRQPDPETVEAVLTRRAPGPCSRCTRAACPRTSTRCARCARRAGIPVLEDAACAVGSTYRRRAGRRRRAAGGLVVPPPQAADHRRGRDGHHRRRASWAARLRRLREHGMNVSARATGTRSGRRGRWSRTWRSASTTG